MAKAYIKAIDGTKVTIEGTPREVAMLVAQLKGGKLHDPRKREIQSRKPKATPLNLISELIDGGFFKKPRELSVIKLALEEQGHYYPITTLSPTLLRLVRRKQIRRVRDKKRWLYVN